jgi:uncharacterized protein YndB with AHSA1/START domain
VELAHPPATVWAALTTAEDLAAWFGNEAAIDLRRPCWQASAWSPPNPGEQRRVRYRLRSDRCPWRSSSWPLWTATGTARSAR